MRNSLILCLALLFLVGCKSQRFVENYIVGVWRVESYHLPDNLEFATKKFVFNSNMTVDLPFLSPISSITGVYSIKNSSEPILNITSSSDLRGDYEVQVLQKNEKNIFDDRLILKSDSITITLLRFR